MTSRHLVVEEPEVVAPVDPLVPVLLDVPVDPLGYVDGDVVVELPVEPMLDVEPELEVDGIDDDELDDGDREVELPVEPMPEVDPEVDAPVEPVVDDPLVVPELDGRDWVAVDDEDGLVDPVAEPPAAPMPEAEPLAVPVELQAARAAAHAAARISFCIRISLSNARDGGCRAGVNQGCATIRGAAVALAARIRVRHGRAGLSDKSPLPQRASSLARSFFSTPSGPNSSTSSACPGRTGWLR